MLFIYATLKDESAIGTMKSTYMASDWWDSISYRADTSTVEKVCRTPLFHLPPHAPPKLGPGNRHVSSSKWSNSLLTAPTRAPGSLKDGNAEGLRETAVQENMPSDEHAPHSGVRHGAEHLDSVVQLTLLPHFLEQESLRPVAADDEVHLWVPFTHDLRTPYHIGSVADLGKMTVVTENEKTSKSYCSSRAFQALDAPTTFPQLSPQVHSNYCRYVETENQSSDKWTEKIGGRASVPLPRA